MEFIKVEFASGIYSWPYMYSYTVEDLARDIKSSLKLDFIPKIGLYGSILPPDSDFMECIIDTDIITPLYYDEVTKIALPGNFLQNQALQPGCFHIYTTYNYESLIYGFIDRIDVNQDFSSTKNQIIHKVKSKYSITNKNIDVIVYLAGGLPYINGTISDFINAYPDAKPNIYVTIFNQNTPLDFNSYKTLVFNQFTRFGSLADPIDKLLVSPFIDLSEDDLKLGAATIGLLPLIYNGTLLNIIGWLEDKIKFSPVFTSLSDTQNASRIHNHNIMTISSVFLCIAQEINSISQKGTNDLWLTVFNLLGYMDDRNIKSTGKITTKYSPFLANLPFEEYFSKFMQGIDPITFYNQDFTDHYGIINPDDLPTFNVILDHGGITFIIHRIADLRNIPTSCIFQGQSGPILYKRRENYKSDEPKIKLVIVRPEKGVEEVIDLEEEAKQINSQVEIATPEDIKQINIVCCDTSLSMGDKIVITEKTTRLDVAKQAFRILAKRAFYMGPQTVWGLVKFSSTPETVQKLTIITNDFYKAIDNLEPNGMTALYAACEEAMNMILKEKNNDGTPKYANAQKRIILLTDGEDTACKEPETIPVLINRLNENDIHVDFIEVDNCNNPFPRNLAVMTGGEYFKAANNEYRLKKLFESDGFYNLELRQFSPKITARLKDPNDKRDVKYQEQLREPRAHKSTPSLKNFEAMLKLHTMEPVKAAIKRLNDLEQVTKIQKTVREQLKDIASQLPSSPFMKVLVKKSDCTQWLVWIKGKRRCTIVEEDRRAISPFRDCWFKLVVLIPKSFPGCPPEIRFIRAPMHPQITSDGSIGLDILRNKFNQNMSIYYLLHSVRTLLATHDFTNIFNVDFENSHQIQRCTMSENPPDDDIFDDSEYNVNLVCRQTVIAKYCDPFTFQAMKEPVKASSGNYFDRRSLERAFADSRVVIDPRNGKRLNANDANLQIDHYFNDKIQNYKAKHNITSD